MSLIDHIQRRLLQPIPKRESDRRAVWVHGVSVGEILAARPLVDAYRKAQPDWDVIVSSSTKLGVAAARDKFDDACVLSFPIDLPWRVRRAFDHLRPDLVLIVEHDLWPNFLRIASRRKVPVVLINARLSERSRQRAQRWKRIITWPSRHLSAICAQDSASSSGFRELGFPEERIYTTGNLKFDSPPPAEASGYRERLGYSANDWILVAGSTHEGEEEAALSALAAVRQNLPEAKLILVPRRIERCPQIEGLIASRGFSQALWTGGFRKDVDVLLVDTIGELAKISGLGDVVFVGGTIAPVGGHNVIEPASLGRPVVIGPNYQNAKSVVRDFTERDAIRIVEDEAEFVAMLVELARDRSMAEALGKRAREVVEENIGATEKTLSAIQSLIASP